MARDLDRLREEVVRALPAWQVLVVQYNDAIAARLGVTASDLQCLFVLSKGAVTPGVIAREIGITTGAASRMVDRLLAAGLATRTPDPHDRRRVLVAATEAALARVAAGYEPLNDELRRELRVFDADGLRRMLEFVHGAERVTRRLMRVDEG